MADILVANKHAGAEDTGTSYWAHYRGGFSRRRWGLFRGHPHPSRVTSPAREPDVPERVTGRELGLRRDIRQLDGDFLTDQDITLMDL